MCAAIRGLSLPVGGKSYRILRGDLHRHTDISPDGIGDGSLMDFYRYAFTAGQYDYMIVTDHQYGDTSITGGVRKNRRTSFLVAGRFWPLLARSAAFPIPMGIATHFSPSAAIANCRYRRASQPERSTRTDPVSYLRERHGLTSSHSTGSDQGTDWRDNDPQLEPLVEIYQGSIRPMNIKNAPRADTPERRYYHHGEAWRPLGSCGMPGPRG